MGDPFDLLGKPADWSEFGSDPNDLAADAERRAMAAYIERRLRKAGRYTNEGGEAVANIVCGGTVSLAGVVIAGAGGPNALTADAYDRWIAICTFAWYQALGIYDQTGRPS